MVEPFVIIVQQPAQAPTPPAPPAAPAAPVTVGGGDAQAPATVGDEVAPGKVIIYRDGTPVVLDGAMPAGISQSGDLGPFADPALRDHVFSLAKDGIIGFTMIIIAFPLFGFLKALVNRRANTAALALPRESTERLERIERAVDAMAVEVERISEGQRFVTKVLGERSAVER